jgi:hypothetical protein
MSGVGCRKCRDRAGTAGFEAGNLQFPRDRTITGTAGTPPLEEPRTCNFRAIAR